MKIKRPLPLWNRSAHPYENPLYPFGHVTWSVRQISPLDYRRSVKQESKFYINTLMQMSCLNDQLKLYYFPKIKSTFRSLKSITNICFDDSSRL